MIITKAITMMMKIWRMMEINLYNLVGVYKQAQEMLEDDSFDLSVAIDTLDSIEGAIEVKAQNTVYLIRNIEGYSNGLASEIKLLQAKQKAAENKIESIKNYLFGQLELAGMTEIKTSIAKIVQQKNPPSVIIEDEALVPAKYQTVIPESYKISKTDIARDLKSGIDVAGCKLTQGKSWRIK